MLPANNRLVLKKYASPSFKGQRLQSREFDLVYRRLPQVFKAAIIISKKTARLAVDRNRIKRLISEALRNQQIFEGELVIKVKENLKGLKMPEVKQKIETQLKKIR